MIFRMLPIFLATLLTTGCQDLFVRQYAIYEVFRMEDTNKLVKLVPINHAYYCKKNDRIYVRLQHIGPDKEFLEWEATATNHQTRKIENNYSTPHNIPLSQAYNFTVNTSGEFSITFTTWLAKRNIPMQSHKKLDEMRMEGKILLIVQEEQTP